MLKKEIIEKLNKISIKLNGVVGRLTTYRNYPPVKEAHEISLECGCDIDDLINEL